MIPQKQPAGGKTRKQKKTLADDVIDEPTGSRKGMLPAIQYLVPDRKS